MQNKTMKPDEVNETGDLDDFWQDWDLWEEDPYPFEEEEDPYPFEEDESKGFSLRLERRTCRACKATFQACVDQHGVADEFCDSCEDGDIAGNNRHSGRGRRQTRFQDADE